MKFTLKYQKKHAGKGASWQTKHFLVTCNRIPSAMTGLPIAMCSVYILLLSAPYAAVENKLS
jgi:hypothetical protein